MSALCRIAPLAALLLVLPATAQARLRVKAAHKATKAPKHDDRDTKSIEALKKINVADFDWRTDVIQGSGEGYFLSAVDSLLKLEPRALDAHIATNVDGSLKVDDKVRVDVFFWERQASGKFAKTVVKLDGRTLLAPDGKEPLVKGFGGKPMLPLLQRAYAQFREGQGYRSVKGAAHVADDAYTGALMEALVGRSAEKAIVLKATPTFADEVFNRINLSLNEGRVIVAATPFQSKDLRARLADAVGTGLTSSRSIDMTLAGEGLAEGHAYTLFDAKRVMVSDDEIAKAKAQNLIADEDVETQGDNKSVRYVYLRTAAVEHDAVSVSARGMFRIPLRKFAILCDRVYVGPQVVAATESRQALR